MGNSLVPKGAPIDIPKSIMIESELLYQATFPAHSPAGTIIKATLNNGGAWMLDMSINPFYGGEVWCLVDIYTVGESCPIPEIRFEPVFNGKASRRFYFSSVNLWKERKPMKLKYLRTAFKLHRRQGLRQAICLKGGDVLSGQMVAMGDIGPYPIVVTFRAWLQRFKL